MDVTLIFTAIGQAFDVVKSLGLGIVNLWSKGKPDVTELAKAQHDYDLAVQNLDFQLKQAALWTTDKLIAMEQATGARWRTPLILTSGIALVLVAVNNILAAVYFDWAHPIDMLSPPMGVLAGMFLLLVTGSAEILVKVFNANKKPANPDTQVATKTGG